MGSANRELVREGELVTTVIRPDLNPTSGVYNWGWARRDVKLWTQRANPRQQVRVSYKLYRDPVLLGRMIERAQKNQSRTSVRGWARVTADGHIDEGFTPSRIAEIVRYAANNAAHRSTEGPASVTVKLLEALEPFDAICSQCQKTFAEHVPYQERFADGGWVDLPDGRREWDNSVVNVRTLHACPGQDLPAPTPLKTAQQARA